ncbi:MAG: sterol desaturase family protein [Planctomycetota bacterium]|nr:sterol desaturase family protein [Planctomycetota bacterium]
MDWDFLAPILNEFTNPSRRLYWPYLLMAGGMALLLVFLRKSEGWGSFRAFVDTAEKRRSLRTDLVFFLSNQFIFAAFFLPLLIQQEAVTTWTIQSWGLSIPVLFEGTSLPLNLTLSLFLVVIFDGTLFLVHWAMHRVPVLWSFHKVHHGAEALNPLTAHRSHPLEISITTFVLAITMGPSTACLQLLFPAYELFDLWGANVFLVAFYFLGYNLRHSHIWLDYPKVIKLALISPAQHQVHHSVAKEHWDKNYGFIFSFWDRALGTYYSSSARENLTFGLSPEDQKKYRQVGQLYFEPFVDAAQCLRRKDDL